MILLLFCYSDDKYLFRLEDALRGFLLKLNVAESLLKPLPQSKYIYSIE